MANVNAAAIKLIKNNFTAHLDEALTEHVRGVERFAGRVRLMLALIFGFSAFWIWEREETGRLICLGLMIAWLAMRMLARARQRSETSTRLVTLYTLIDISIVNLGMAAFAHQGYALESTGLFLAYFPILAVAANRYRAGLVLLASSYAIIFFLLLSQKIEVAPWLQLSLLMATVYVFASGSQRPKSLVNEVAEKELNAAYDLGYQQAEQELTQFAHQLLLPAPQVDLPGLWCTGKHGAGSKTGGDYYQIFKKGEKPLVVVGDLGGDGHGALNDVKMLHLELNEIVERESSLTAIAAGLNRWLVGKFKGRRPFTCVLAEWSGEEMRYINAGHLPMIQISKPQGAQPVNQRTLPVTSAVLGVDAEVSVTESVVPFPIRDLMVVYTDGVFAKLTSDREKGISEIEAMAERFSSGEVNTLCHRIFDCAQPGFDRNTDDATVVVIRRQPE
ncbi:MAG: serine/threonine-protein phosphatase [Acidobacteria bacterium]|nr:serine/threonine-protein phosphatase [Acidobacteriota bacterium]